MTQSFKLTLIWIAGCMLAFVVALNFLPAALVDGHYIPVSNDSFYHARRILDAVANPSGFYEFDPNISYPEGSWISWPWGYDWLMAKIVRLCLAIFGQRDPMSILDYIPVFAMTLTMGLVLTITSLLRLPLTLRALIVLCFAVSPLTQSLHAVGMIDHHYAEHIFILLSLALTMVWLRNPAHAWWPVAAGLALGASVAIHNGLFLLQLPVLIAIGVNWLRGTSVDRQAALRFATALFVTTLMVALPAHAFRVGDFKFYFLSAFHVYVAFCSAAMVILLSRLPFSRRSLLWIGIAAAVLLVPIATQVVLGGEFVTGQLTVLQGIDEVRSPVSIAFSDNAGRISRLYSLFGWCAPLFLVASLIGLFRDRRPEMTYFWAFSCMSLTLLLLQLRFSYYGSIALYTIPFLLLNGITSTMPRWQKAVVPLSILVAVVTFVPSLKVHLFTHAAAALDPMYANTRQLYPRLAEACKEHRGLALGNTDQGHYIRFHTDCPVIANNFRLTAQDLRKTAEVEHLYTLDAKQLLKEAPDVRYVIATAAAFYIADKDGGMREATREELRQNNEGLVGDLLASDPAALGPRYRLLREVQLNSESKLPLGRLFEIVPQAEQAVGESSDGGEQHLLTTHVRK